MNAKKLQEKLERLEVLSDIYNDLAATAHPSKEIRDNSALKMKLLKKEMLLLNYLISKEISNDQD